MYSLFESWGDIGSWADTARHIVSEIFWPRKGCFVHPVIALAVASEWVTYPGRSGSDATDQLLRRATEMRWVN